MSVHQIWLLMRKYKLSAKSYKRMLIENEHMYINGIILER